MGRENRTNSKRPVKLFLVPRRINSVYSICIETAELSRWVLFFRRLTTQQERMLAMIYGPIKLHTHYAMTRQESVNNAIRLR